MKFKLLPSAIRTYPATVNVSNLPLAESQSMRRDDPVLTILIRAALFAALNYVLSLSLVWLVNVKPLFALLFVSAGVWGWRTSLVTAVLSMGIWTFANPFGPAPLPVAAAQIAGAVLVAIVCLLFMPMVRRSRLFFAAALASVLGLSATLTFFLTVNSVDALINQPFWPWFITGMSFSLLPIVLNAILFPLLLPVIHRLIRLRISA